MSHRELLAHAVTVLMYSKFSYPQFDFRLDGFKERGFEQQGDERVEGNGVSAACVAIPATEHDCPTGCRRIPGG